MKKSKWIKISLSWLLVVIWVLVIYAFSNKNAVDSSSSSSTVIMWIHSFFPFVEDNDLSQLIVRKMAHMGEYAIMLALCYNACKVTWSKYTFISLLITLGTALFDEFHQTFIDGRAGRVSDVGIDMIGALIMFCFICMFTRKTKNLK